MAAPALPSLDALIAQLARLRALVGEREPLEGADASAQLAARGLSAERIASLEAEAQAVLARAAAIQGDGPLASAGERAARVALEAGLIEVETLAGALVEEQVAGEGALSQLIDAAQTIAPTDGAESAAIEGLDTVVSDPGGGPTTYQPGWASQEQTGSFGGPQLETLPPLPAPARRLGRYPVVGKLGAGGMGDVLAVLDETLGRQVAAKVIRGKADEVALRKFVVEARVTGQLEHPSIVPAYELGRAPDGRLYLTMKRVVGKELADLIAEVRRRRADAGPGAGSPEGLIELLQVFLKVCEGVGFAHSKGVVHRDLKPANVMVGDHGEVLVMDWGLARVRGQSIDATTQIAGLLPDLEGAQDDSLRTMAGTIMGTPTYMPPEQARGDVELLDAQADVYALGAILYEMLTLSPPYVGPNGWAVLAMVTAGPPEPPSQRVGDAWPVPWELEAVAVRAMHPDRGQRYPDVPTLVADVQAFLEGRTVSAVDYSAWQLARKFVRRHRRSLAAAAVALLSLIAALSYGVVSARREAARVAAALEETEKQRVAAVAAQRLASQRERQAQRERERADQEAGKAWRNLRKAERMGALETLEELHREEADRLWWTPMAMRGGQPTGVLLAPPSRARLGAVVEAMGRWRERVRQQVARRADFAAARAELDAASDDPWIKLQRTIFGRLVAQADDLQRRSTSVASRQTTYSRRLQRPVDRAAWDAAAERVARSSAYRLGLRLGRKDRLTEQLGLAPLGPDPHSGLEEFELINSGRPLKRGSDGALPLRHDSCVVLVLIPAGRYRVGTTTREDKLALANEGPVHTVALDAFLLAKTELTQLQWRALGSTNRSRWREGVRFGPFKATMQHPAERLSWNDAAFALAGFGLVLPTERQWEAAARGGRLTPWWTGADPAALAAAENVGDIAARRYIGHLPAHDPWNDGHALTAPAASYTRGPRHPFGLHDVLGNVREWCLDVYRADAYDAKGHDRRGWLPPPEGAPLDRRVARGGDWQFRAQYARVTVRHQYAPALRSDLVGVRPARQLVFQSRGE